MDMPFFSSKNMNFILCAFVATSILSCAEAVSSDKGKKNIASEQVHEVLPGIYAFDRLLAKVQGKRVAVVTNHTGLIGNTHVVDSLLSSGIQVAKVFAPEHGFRGNRPDGEEFVGSRDPKTGIEIISLYGKTKSHPRNN